MFISGIFLFTLFIIPYPVIADSGTNAIQDSPPGKMVGFSVGKTLIIAPSEASTDEIKPFLEQCHSPLDICAKRYSHVSYYDNNNKPIKIIFLLKGQKKPDGNLSVYYMDDAVPQGKSYREVYTYKEPSGETKTIEVGGASGGISNTTGKLTPIHMSDELMDAVRKHKEIYGTKDNPKFPAPLKKNDAPANKEQTEKGAEPPSVSK
jgi:hypothetical protein